MKGKGKGGGEEGVKQTLAGQLMHTCHTFRILIHIWPDLQGLLLPVRRIARACLYCKQLDLIYLDILI